MKARQAGTTSVEFAIVGTAAMLLLLGVIEVGRMIFVVNALGEASRRGARLAAVCPINDPAIARTTVFSRSGGGAISPLLRGLSTDNVRLEYLDDAGAVIADPTSNAGFLDIRYVRVSIQNFRHQLVLPLPIGAFELPNMPTTVPRESLGVPRDEAIRPC